MKTFILYNEQNPKSLVNAKHSLASFEKFSGWEPRLYNGIWRDSIEQASELFMVSDGERTKFKKDDTLYKSKFACFLSHYSIWERCYLYDEPIAVLENDTQCLRDFNIEFDYTSTAIIQLTMESMINPMTGVVPHMGIKRLKEYNKVGEGVHKIFFDHPHGEKYLAGNVGYIITPKAAKYLVMDCKENGWTQNDLLMNDETTPLFYVNPSPIKYLKSKELKSSSIKSI